jgi:hypothetical protein
MADPSVTAACGGLAVALLRYAVWDGNEAAMTAMILMLTSNFADLEIDSVV